MKSLYENAHFKTYFKKKYLKHSYPFIDNISLKLLKRYFDNEGGVNAGYSVIDGLMVKKQN